MSLGPPADDSRVRKTALTIAVLIFSAIIVVSLALAPSVPINLPSAGNGAPYQTRPSPFVVVEVVEESTTTYTTTFTTTPQPFIVVQLIPEVLVVDNGTNTYTTATTLTTTSTTWR